MNCLFVRLFSYVSSSGFSVLNNLAVGTIISWCLLLAAPGFASDSSEEVLRGTVLEQQETVANPRLSSIDPNDLSNSIDPDHYYIGGGDWFAISAVGNPAIHYTVPITSQLELYIPPLGLKKLGKITLSAAQKEIADFVQEKLKKKSDIHVELTKIKKVMVSITGAVANPGTYTLSGSLRLLDALRQANNGVLPSLNRCDYREVQCSGKDRTTTVDLFGYLLKSDLASNPYLYPGTNIAISFQIRHIYINAPMKSIVSGWIPIQEKETLSHLLGFFTFDASADTSLVLLQSTLQNGSRSTRKILWGDATQVMLEDGDVVTIALKKSYGPSTMVAVRGEVAQPGYYPILRDSSTASEVLQMVGGVTEYADVHRAAIIRRSKAQSGDSLKLLASSQVPPIRPEMSAGILQMNMIQDYLIIDLEKEGLSIKLSSDDILVIPKADPFIYVSGEVKHPGAYKYTKGKPYRFYVGLAGGYTRKADRTNQFGVRYFDGVSQITDLSEMRAADVLVVPASQQGKLFVSFLLPMLQTVGTILSVILAFYTLSKQ